MEEKSDLKRSDNVKKQIILYFVFAISMILLNYLVQKSNQLFISPYVCQNFDKVGLIKTLYCSLDPYNMPELIGSIAAVGITYIVKFFLDKFVVFQKTSVELKETSIEFLKYFVFAILTTIENIGIQFLMTNFLGTPLEISMTIALTIGYTTKFFLDKFVVFQKTSVELKETSIEFQQKI